MNGNNGNKPKIDPALASIIEQARVKGFLRERIDELEQLRDEDHARFQRERNEERARHQFETAVLRSVVPTSQAPSVNAAGSPLISETFKKFSEETTPR